MALHVGEAAPQFSAQAYLKNASIEIRLSEYSGQWVVLVFVPGIFTCVCPTEIAALAVKYPAMREIGAEVIAVSSDTIDDHRKFQEELLTSVPGGARFPLVADPDGTVGSLYGVYVQSQKLHLRSHFIIDPEGILQAMEIISPVIGRNVAEILRQLRALGEYRRTGQYIPCGWEPGKPTIPPPDPSGKPNKILATWKPSKAF